MEMGWKPNVEVSPPCPRCGSFHTKFCYYNNYSLTQPRYFCKACRRYWTKGGSLRNVPVGGGCRKTRRPKSTRPVATHSGGASSSSSISAPHDPPSSDIDVAAVYANFVSHASPRQRLPETAPYLHGEAINVPSVEFSNGFFEFEQFPLGFGTGNGFMSNIPMGSGLLPPLPGEEGLPPWPNSDAMYQNQNQEIIGGDVQRSEENSELVNGNMGMFSGLNLEAIFRT